MHHYVTDNYDLSEILELTKDNKVRITEVRPVEDRSNGGFTYIWPKGEWVIHHHNSSNPNGPVHITLRSIDGEELKFDDPRRVTIKLPFGLLAEFVGFRVARDRMSAAEHDEGRPRHILGLAEQGPEPSP